MTIVTIFIIIILVAVTLTWLDSVSTFLAFSYTEVLVRSPGSSWRRAAANR